MSLVNLSYVCSHLQNASLARLGLTSVPYTKLHLSLALLLQKQGFLSQVKLGGPSPPASCFPSIPGRSHLAAPRSQEDLRRNRLRPEAALARVVRYRQGRKDLKSLGFNWEAIEFAEKNGMKSVEELEVEGWPQRVFELISRLQEQISRSEQQTEKDVSADDVSNDILYQLTEGQKRIWHDFGGMSKERLDTIHFTAETLHDMAGPEAFKSERRVRQEGITIEAMGLSIPNQPIDLPDEHETDESLLDVEGVVTQENRASRRLWLGMKYYNSSPVLSKARMISKPSKRIWLNSRELSKLIRGNRAGEVKPLMQVGEIMAVSTERGIMEVRDCVDRQLGGMPLCRVW